MLLPISTILALLVLAGCGGTHVKQEFKTIQESVENSTQYNVTWYSPKELENKYHELEQRTPDTLTRKQAIAYVLQFNPDLYVEFQELGIAKADLIEAGLFTNPELATLVRFPHKEKDLNAQCEADLGMQLSDLWQVPLRKQVSADHLEIVSQRIVRKILSVISETSVAYDTCVYEIETLKIIEEILSLVKKRYELLKERYHYGFNDELAIHRQAGLVAEWEIKYHNQQAQVKMAYWHLFNMAGLSVTKAWPKLVETLDTPRVALATPHELFSYAQQHHPTALISRLKIQRYEHLISYERSRVIQHISVGISYDHEYEGFNGLGPLIALEVPLFNQNQASIARAQFLLDQAKHALNTKLGNMEEEIFSLHERIEVAQQEITIYSQRLFPAVKQAVEFVTHYSKTMQVTSLEFNDTIQAYYQAQQYKLDSLYTLRSSIAKLEEAVGKKLLPA